MSQEEGRPVVMEHHVCQDCHNGSGRHKQGHICKTCGGSGDTKHAQVNRAAMAKNAALEEAARIEEEEANTRARLARARIAKLKAEEDAYNAQVEEAEARTKAAKAGADAARQA